VERRSAELSRMARSGSRRGCVIMLSWNRNGFKDILRHCQGTLPMCSPRHPVRIASIQGVPGGDQDHDGLGMASRPGKERRRTVIEPRSRDGSDVLKSGNS
jgi:hypothetical protein